MNSQTITLHVTPNELDTILDALRSLQSWGEDDSGDEIDDLCERLNLGE